MPLGRFTVRNEYGLGVKELYKEGVECEDPKAVLDGVAVAGLVGLLRQLGDLSQFAAEVFHGLQEQVASTVSRSRKLVTRVQHIEASLPSLEKAILSQTSHIHFAYSPGSEWHPRIKNEQNHFICDDLPHFIMDSYEECHEPPRLQLLDRFDKGGPGSCLQRYSDPTFFRRTSGSSVTSTKEKSQLERKIRKIKRRRSRQRSERFSSCAPTINNSERVQSSSQTAGIEPSLSHPGTTLNKSSISDREDQSESVASINSNQSRKTKNNEVSSTVDENMADKTVQGGFACHNNVPHCSDITWDEKLEIMEHMGLNYGVEEVQNVPETDYDLHQKDIKPISVENDDQVEDFSEDQLIEPSEQDFHEHGVKTDYAKNSQADDISEITSCTESDADVHCVRTTTNEKFLDSTRRNYFYEQQVTPINMEGSKSSANGKYPTTTLDWDVDPTTQKNNEIDEDKDFNLHEHDSVQMYSEPFPQVTNISEGEETPHANSLVLANSDSFRQVTEFSKDGNPPTFVVNENFVDHSFGRKLRIGDVQYMLETIENDKWALETIKPEQVDISLAQVSEFSNGDNRLCISDGHYALESKLEDVKLEARTISEQYDGPLATEAVNNMNLIEWPYRDDIDSETDNFVDALNTIDSESESEYETQTKTDVEPSNSKWKLLETQSTDHLRRYDSKDIVYSKSPESSVSSHEQQGATSHEKEQEQNTQMPLTQGTGETRAEKLVDPLTSKWKLTGNESTGLMVENIKQFQLEHDFHSRMYGSNDQVYDHSEQPISLENVVSIHKSELATNQEQGVVPSFSQGIEATLTNEQVDPSASESKQLRNASFDLVVENRNQSERQPQFLSRMSDINDGANDGSEQEYLENAVSTHQSAANDSLEQQYLENAVSTHQSAANDSSEQEYVENAVSTHQSAANDSSEQQYLENAVSTHQSAANDSSEQEYVENAVSTHQSAANDSSEQQYLENAVSTHQSAANDSSEQEYVENAVSTHQSARETSQELEVVPCFSHEQSVQIPPSLSIFSQGADICVKTDEIILQPAVHKPVESSSQASEDSTSVEGPFESTNSHAHALWTNGTLFGLQPSKPTVVSTSNSAPMSNGPGRIIPLSVKKSDGLDKKYMKSLDHDKLNINDSLVSGLSNGQISFQESTVLSSANLDNVHSEADNTSEDRSSLLSLLARNLLNNGVRRSASLDYSEGTKPNYSGAQELLPQSNLKSTLSSPPPSPPLEHMKISFRPVDSFETSRLKLKYPERVDNHEITVETFPSFQLVPESTRFQHDMGSDSDDDTFCRSYPCVSDDSVGHISDSDSEQWESGDTSESNDHDHTFYDGFRQISSTESSSSQQDLPPQLPPLPPLQWRASKPVLDEAKANDISHLGADDTAKLKHGRQKSDTIGKQEKVAETKLYDRKQNLLTTGEKTVDDQNDFLRQIRAKSFNLKRTDAARSLQTPSLSTSNKVTAILQKASAIRKAVGSDAEDDSWSDT